LAPHTPIAQLLDAGVAGTWLLCALVIVAFTVDQR
jgi:hypothetical protein